MTANYLQIISGSRAGQKFEVNETLLLGRSAGCHMQFTGPEGSLVSGKHASISASDDGLVLKDLGSTNGTFVNGGRVEEVRLQGNQIISLGLNGPKIRVMGESAFTGMSLVGALENPQEDVEPLEATRTDKAAGTRESVPMFGPADGSYTMGLAQRLHSDEAGEDELQDLIRNRGRAERIVKSGVLSTRDARMIQSASQTYSRGRKAATWGISIICVVAVIVVSILGYQNFTYRQRLEEQATLLSNIRQLESELEGKQVAQSEGAVDEERALLVAKLRAAERKLMQVRGSIHSEDLINTYQNPLGREIHQILEGFGKQNYIVPDIFTKQVEKHIHTFTKTSTRRIIDRTLKNKAIHERLILNELLKAGMPSAFLYLAMHESLLDSVIVSHAGARGLWQFMPRTAREYGLKVPENWRDLPPEADERTHPLKATKAAIKYLKVLYGEFGDVALAMAAYNAGEGRIRRELRRIEDPINNRDFWYIYRTGTLAEETNEYVPKIIATMIVDKNRNHYGF